MESNGAFSKFRLFAKTMMFVHRVLPFTRPANRFAGKSKSGRRYVKVETSGRGSGGQSDRSESKHRAGQRIMSPVERGSRAGVLPDSFCRPARNLFTPEDYNGASATREFVPLLAIGAKEKKTSKRRENIRGVRKKKRKKLDTLSTSEPRKALFIFISETARFLSFTTNYLLPRVTFMFINIY